MKNSFTAHPSYAKVKSKKEINIKNEVFVVFENIF